MKTVFVILFLLNIIVFIAMPFFSEKKPNAAPTMLNAEKIILLPVNNDCLEWGNFYEEQIQYADNVMKETYPELSYKWENVGTALKYWLVIPALPNKEATNRMINKLRNFGIASFRVKKQRNVGRMQFLWVFTMISNKLSSNWKRSRKKEFPMP